MTALQRLAGVVRAEGGLLAPTVVDPDPLAAGPLGALAGRGARATDLAFVVETVYEGYLLHHARPRVVVVEDPDLALLAGDHLYAHGLARLAELGEVEAVGILAGVIATCSQAHAEGRPEDAAAAWREGAGAIGEAGARQVGGELAP